MNTSLVIVSCDNYDDCWKLFFHFKDKYWKDCPYKSYLITETKKSEYCETINIDSNVWTKRLREALKQIDTKYIIFMTEDSFIRGKVNQKEIDRAIWLMNEDIITINLCGAKRNKDFYNEEDVYGGYVAKRNNAVYMNGCSPSIWDREKLIERLEKNQSPWEWELTKITSKYKQYVNVGEHIIDNGYYNYNFFAIHKGKWMREVERFFLEEGVDVDYGKRGFFN
ncbi:MAG: hypothetical protein KAX49_07305 [Halanaerobiales bacterium]|nr:hypothetical protein [Halanaerobiales bacterium]